MGMLIFTIVVVGLLALVVTSPFLLGIAVCIKQRQMRRGPRPPVIHPPARVTVVPKPAPPPPSPDYMRRWTQDRKLGAVHDSQAWDRAFAAAEARIGPPGRGSTRGVARPRRVSGG